MFDGGYTDLQVITEREGDLQDCKAIITGTMVDWMIFLKELEE